MDGIALHSGEDQFTSKSFRKNTFFKVSELIRFALPHRKKKEKKSECLTLLTARNHSPFLCLKARIYCTKHRHREVDRDVHGNVLIVCVLIWIESLCL